MQPSLNKITKNKIMNTLVKFKLFILIFSQLLTTLIFSQADTGSYTQLLNRIEIRKREFKDIYISEDTQRKDSVIEVARRYLFGTAINELFPYWYGTPWDFNGTTRVPGEGRIACGYFVTNTLTDMGFNIPRVKWAQSASEVFIRKLSAGVKHFSNAPVSKVREYLLQSGNGLYLVGLDCHVGFIAVTGDSIRFIHSNYYQPEKGVMSEDIETENPFSDSAYRVIGKIFGDEMIRKWIQGESFY